MAIATFAAAGCASDGYYGGYDTYPGEAYYDYGPYGYSRYGYGRPYGYGAPAYYPYFYDHRDRDDDDDDDDDDHDARYFRPAHGVICDRERDICRNKSGVSERWTNRIFDDEDDEPSRPRKIERRQRLADDADRDFDRPAARRHNRNDDRERIQRPRRIEPERSACPPSACPDK